MGEFDHYENRREIFSKAVKAGKRTYFFDVKATRGDDYYLTITESKKIFDKEGEKAFYEKHKIFLFKEDFEKFIEGLNEAIDHIKIHKPDMPDRENPQENKKLSDFDFDDLGKKSSE